MKPRCGWWKRDRLLLYTPPCKELIELLGSYGLLVHGSLRAGMLEWVVMPFSRGFLFVVFPACKSIPGTWYILNNYQMIVFPRELLEPIFCTFSSYYITDIVNNRFIRGRHDWMASPTQRTWVWVNSRSWWWTGRPGVLQSMGLQRVGHDWATELNWTELYIFSPSSTIQEFYSKRTITVLLLVVSQTLHGWSLSLATDPSPLQRTFRFQLLVRRGCLSSWILCA